MISSTDYMTRQRAACPEGRCQDIPPWTGTMTSSSRALMGQSWTQSPGGGGRHWGDPPQRRRLGMGHRETVAHRLHLPWGYTPAQAAALRQLRRLEVNLILLWFWPPVVHLQDLHARPAPACRVPGCVMMPRCCVRSGTRWRWRTMPTTRRRECRQT